MNSYLLLAIAILSETFSTSMLKLSAGFSKPLPSSLFVVGMATSFYFLSRALMDIPLSVAYAIWAGCGTALTVMVGFLVWQESIDLYKAIGLVLIISGVVILNLKGNVH